MTTLRTRITAPFTAFLTATSIAATAAAAPPDPGVALLGKVSVAESSVAFIDAKAVRSERKVSEALTKIDRCVSAVDAALAAGFKNADEAKVYDSSRYANGRKDKQPGRTAVHFAPLSEIRGMCQALRNQVGVGDVIRAVDEARGVEKQLATKKLGRTDARVAEVYHTKCTAAVDKALERKINKQASLETEYGTMTLAEAKEKGCGPIGALIAKAQSAGQAAQDARFAPWKKALKGDKIKTFLGKKMIHFRVYTKRGKQLNTPADFAKASVWFEVLRSGHPRKWRMKRFAFRGNKLVSTKVIEGRGRKAPSKAFR